MLFEALSAARDLGRLHEIAMVLVRHGLGDALRRMGVAGALERAGRALHFKGAQGIASKSTPQRVREALEDLGPTFVKVGQILAGRSDLLPPVWIEELSALLDSASKVPFEKIEPQLTEDLGASPGEVFDDFDPEPLAAASIAQVHRARLPDGSPVVLKVRRPGIRETVEADLRLLARLAELAESEIPELRRYRPRGLVRQLAHTLRDELDMRIEARNAARFADNMESVDGLVVPHVYPQWTCERLCVMEFLDGESLVEWSRAHPSGDPLGARLARLGADAVLRMVFVDGFFHADPHAGNLLLLGEGRLGVLDFGMVGRLSEARRVEFLELLSAIVGQREDAVVDILLGWSQGSATDVDNLTQDCAGLLGRYYGVSMKDLDAAALLGELTTMMRENDLFLAGDVALLLKVFVTLDGLGRSLDPAFVMTERIEPFARRAMRTYRSPFAIMRRGMRELGALMSGMPRVGRQVLQNLRRGRVQIEVGIPHLEEFGRQLDRSANRITVGLVTAALIIGTAIALSVAGGPTVLGLPVFALLGFSSSIAAGVWLMWSIMRSGRR